MSHPKESTDRIILVFDETVFEHIRRPRIVWMRRVKRLATVMLMLTIFATPEFGWTQEMTSNRGRNLYENHCTACHDTRIHRRSIPKARSLVEVEQFVARWSQYLRLSWSAEDHAEVVNYLNRQFYNYEPTTH